MDYFASLRVRDLALALPFCVTGYVVFNFLYQIIYYRFFHPLSKFPGPFWASVTRIWLEYQDIRGRDLQAQQKLHQKYGPIVRATPTLLLISDATALPEIYHRQVNKSPFYINGAFGERESIFNTQDWKAHAELRKVLAGPYSFSNVKNMEPLIDRRIKSWLKRLRSDFAETGDVFDLAMWATYLVFDVISEVGFGKPIGFIQAGEDVSGLIRGWHVGLWAFSLTSRLHTVTAWLKKTPLNKFLVASPEQNFGIGVMMKFRDELIDQRIRDIEEGKLQEGSRVDLLQHFLSSPSLDLEQTRAEALLVMIAGADTTATVMGAIFHHLSRSPRSYHTLLRELRSALASSLLSLPVPTYDQITAHLPYYTACVREALRLSPAAPQILCRNVGGGSGRSFKGLSVAGRKIPETKEGEVEVACNPYIVNRDPRVWGVDAEEFRPERWVQAEREEKSVYEERVRLFNRYLMSWGYGTRVCLGKELAIMDLWKAPVTLLLGFEVEGLGEGGGEMALGRYKTRGGIAWFVDMGVRVRKRDEGWWREEEEEEGKE